MVEESMGMDDSSGFFYFEDIVGSVNLMNTTLSMNELKMSSVFMNSYVKMFTVNMFKAMDETTQMTYMDIGNT
jgi:hypothetical protein